MNRALIYEGNTSAHPVVGWPGPHYAHCGLIPALDEVNCVGRGASMALDSKPFSNPGLDEPEPIVLHSPEAFNFQPYSLTILCSAYLKVIATVPTIENSKAAAAGPAFYLCRAGSKAAGERGARKRNAKTIPSVSFIRSPLVVSFAPLSSAATALSPFTFAGGNRVGSHRTKHIAIYGRKLWL